MASIRVFFACIAHFFSALWISFVSLTTFKWRKDSKTCDIEAGLPPPSIPEKERITVCNGTHDVEVGNGLCASTTDEFVDVDLSMNTQSTKTFEKKNQAMNFEHLAKAIRFDQPTRRPSGRMSAVDPVKSRILDTTLKNVQDMAIDVVKPVIITQGTLNAVAYTAQVEYYHGTIIEPCSAQIEYFEGPVATTVKVEYLHAPITDSVDEPPSESCTITLHHHDQGNHNIPADAPMFKSFAFNVEDVDAPNVKSSVCGTEHTEITLRDSYYETQYDYYPREIPFTPPPEKKSRRVKGKRARQRESLFDLIAQFPDIPHHTPPGRERSSIGHKIKESMTGSPNVEIVPQSPTSSESSASSSGSDVLTYYGLTADDTAQTSAPNSPELTSGPFSAVQGDHFSGNVAGLWNACPLVGSHEMDASARPNIDQPCSPQAISDSVSMKHIPAENVVSISCVLPSESRRASNLSESEPQFHSNLRSLAHDAIGHDDQYNPQTGLHEEEPTVDRIIIESQKAAAYAILSAPHDDSDVRMDSLLGQLAAPSFDSTYMRPQSLAWFMDRTVRGVVSAEFFLSSLAPVERTRATVAPLRIVKKTNAQPSELDAATVETTAKADVKYPALVERDPVLAQECARWEESRQAGIKAFREAVVGDDDFYNLFYRDSCRYSQSSLATDVLGLIGDFATASISGSNSDMALNECLPFDESIESEETDEMSSSFDFSNNTEVTVPDEHASVSPFQDFAIKDLGRGSANGSSDLSFDEDGHQASAWISPSDSEIGNEDNNILCSTSFELDA